MEVVAVKITIAYIPEEQEEATAVLTALRPLLAWEKVRKSDRHPPYLHIYLTTINSGKSYKSKKNT